MLVHEGIKAPGDLIDAQGSAQIVPLACSASKRCVSMPSQSR
jgi:hypothetical protein